MDTSSNPREPQAALALSATDLLVGLGVLALALLSVPIHSDALILGNDVVPYAAGLAAGGEHALVNPHHLAFHPLAWLALQLVQLAVPSGVPIEDALRAQVWVSAAGFALAAVVIFRFGREQCGALRAGLVTALFATCATNWLYGSVGESYLPANAAIAGLLAAALRIRLGRAPARARTLVLWLLAATLLRQDSVVVALALPLLVPPGLALRVLVIAGAACLGSYFAVWSMFASGEFMPWLRGLADTGNWGGSISWLKAGAGILTFQHAVHYGVRFGGLGAVLSVATTLLATLAALPARGLPRPDGVRVAALGLGCYIVLRHAFFTWWQPTNMEYHAGTLVPLALLACVGLGQQLRGAGRGPLLLGLAVLSAAVGNAYYLLQPNRAQDLRANVESGLEAAGANPLVLSLTALQHYAVLRDAPAEVHKRVVATEARFADPADLAALATDCRAYLERGQSILILRDNVTPARLDVAEQRLESELLAMLYGLGSVTRLDRGDGDVWGLVVAPAD